PSSSSPNTARRSYSRGWGRLEWVGRIGAECARRLSISPFGGVFLARTSKFSTTNMKGTRNVFVLSCKSRVLFDLSLRVCRAKSTCLVYLAPFLFGGGSLRRTAFWLL
ncbi:unnamed protein product, partial [Ectocarpus sp. 12 AP-2014]